MQLLTTAKNIAKSLIEEHFYGLPERQDTVKKLEHFSLVLLRRGIEDEEVINVMTGIIGAVQIEHGVRTC